LDDLPSACALTNGPRAV